MDGCECGHEASNRLKREVFAIVTSEVQDEDKRMNNCLKLFITKRKSNEFVDKLARNVVIYFGTLFM